MLKILSLLIKPSAGEVFIGGVSTGDCSLQVRRQIGVISHNTFLYDNLTAFENLAFYCKLYDVQNWKQRAEEVLEEVGLPYVLNDPVRTFSRGMQQRLSIARAILHQPSVLFLDEPYTGLDQQAIDILNRVLVRLAGSQRTIFMITHNYEQGLELSDRVLIMDKGRVVFESTTGTLTSDLFKELYRRHVGGIP